MSPITGVLGAFTIAAFGYFVGMADGYHTVATDCERLGSFYVGSKTFKCEVKPQIQHATHGDRNGR